MKLNTVDVVITGLFVALMTVCSWISIPLTVPITLQTLGVFLSVRLLGGRRGTIAVITYILLGALGAPVFSGFKGGPGALLGPTGGYILGFVLSAVIMWVFEAIFGNRTLIQYISMILGLLACYTAGTLWFMTVYSHSGKPISLLTTLSWCVFPFIIPDAVKLLLAHALSKRLRRFVPASVISTAFIFFY